LAEGEEAVSLGWILAGYRLPDPASWSAPARGGLCVLLFSLVLAGAAPTGLALRGGLSPLWAPGAQPPSATAEPHTAGAATRQLTSTLALPQPLPLPAEEAHELWRFALEAGLRHGLVLGWLRPVAPLSHGEHRTPAVVSVRFWGRYPALADWLADLPPSIAVQALKVSTPGGLAGSLPGVPDVPGVPGVPGVLGVPSVPGSTTLLALDATLRAGAAPRPVQAAHPPVRNALASDPFQAPWAAPLQADRREGSTANAAVGERAAERPWLERHALHDMEMVGVLGGEGSTWALLQVQGRLHAARAGQRVGPQGATVEYIGQDMLQAVEPVAATRGQVAPMRRTLSLKETRP